MEYKKLEEYETLSEVPIEHPDIHYICLDPRIYCGDACGTKGCLARVHKFGECIFMKEKGE